MDADEGAREGAAFAEIGGEAVGAGVEFAVGERDAVEREGRGVGLGGGLAFPTGDDQRALRERSSRGAGRGRCWGGGDHRRRGLRKRIEIFGA